MDALVLLGVPAVLGCLVALLLRRRLASARLPPFLMWLLGGAVIILGVGIATAFAITPWVDSEIAACKAMPDTYDCEDAGLVVVMPVFAAGAMTIAWAVAALLLRYLFPRFRTSKA